MVHPDDVARVTEALRSALLYNQVTQVTKTKVTLANPNIVCVRIAGEGGGGRDGGGLFVAQIWVAHLCSTQDDTLTDCPPSWYSVKYANESETG